MKQKLTEQKSDKSIHSRAVKLFSFVMFSLFFTLSSAQQDERGVKVELVEQAGQEAQAEQVLTKVALIIGNSKYDIGALKNPVNDAKTMATTLKSMGFDVIQALDLDNDGMGQVLAQFEKKLKQADVGLFFFAGHGVQVAGQNYLIPVKSAIKSVGDVQRESLSADRILSVMARAEVETSIIILDACRNNPFETDSRSLTGGGLARMDAPTGSIVIYATAPGRTASDGAGDNGLFTGHLLDNMTVPGASIYDVAIATRRDVMKASNGQQVPWELSSLINQFYFVPTANQVQIVIANAQLEAAADTNERPLTILTQPHEANVRIINSEIAYAQGVKLPIGSYQVEVSASGYEPLTKWIDLSQKTAFEFQLSPLLVDQTFSVDEVVFTMKAIKGGEYTMGCQRGVDNCDVRSTPKQSMTVNSFRLMDTETTWGLYKLCVEEGNCDAELPDSEWYVDQMPANMISYLQITEEFIPWLEFKTGQGFRLPTEAEWEYAARGNSNQKTQWRMKSNCKRAKYYMSGKGKCPKAGSPVAVNSYPANGFGLFDMHGNVAELTADCGTRDLKTIPLDGSPQRDGDCKHRMVRGGSFKSDFREMDISNRTTVNIHNAAVEIGFRLAQSPEMTIAQ